MSGGERSGGAPPAPKPLDQGTGQPKDAGVKPRQRRSVPASGPKSSPDTLPSVTQNSKADQAGQALSDLGKAVAAAARAKVQEYTDRVLGGENLDTRGLPQTWTEEIAKRVQQARDGQNPSTTEPSVDPELSASLIMEGLAAGILSTADPESTSVASATEPGLLSASAVDTSSTSLPDTADTSATPAAEAAPSQETVERRQQEEEFERLASNVVQRRGRELDEMTEPQRQAAYAEDASNRDIFALYLLNKTKPENYQDTMGPNGMDPYKDDKREIFVMHEGKRTKVLSILSFDGTSFHCQIKSNVTGDPIRRQIPQQELFRGQLIAVRESLTESQQFTQAQRVVVGEYIDSTIVHANRDSKEVAQAKARIDTRETGMDVNETIIQAAQDSGVTTADNLRGLISATLSTDADQVKREVALHRLEGVNLVNADVMAQVFRDVGWTQETLRTEAEKAMEAFGKLQERAKNHPGDPVLQQQVEVARLIADGMQNLSQQSLEQMLTEHGQRAEQGMGNLERHKQFNEALARGDFGKMAEMVTPDLDDLPPEERDARRKQIEAAFKAMGIGGGIFAFLLYMWIEKLDLTGTSQ